MAETATNAEVMTDPPIPINVGGSPSGMPSATPSAAPPPIPDPTKPYEAPPSSSLPPITPPVQHDPATLQQPSGPRLIPGMKGTSAATIAFGLDSILRGYMRGRDYGEQRKYAQTSRLLGGLQFNYQTAASNYINLLKNGADPNSPEVQQAKAARDAAWTAMMKMYGNYINPQTGKKEGKKSKGGGGDQSNPLEQIGSQNPQDKIRGVYAVGVKLGPPDEYIARQYSSPEYRKQLEMQRGQQSLAQGKIDDELALRNLQLEDTSKMTPEQRAAHDEKVYTLQSRLSGTDKGAEQSAQVRGMQSGLRAVGLSDEEIKKVVSSHYGGAGMRGTSVQQKYADAVQEAIDKGVDPTNYPPAVELAKAIKAEHPPAQRAVTLKTPDGKQVAGKVDHEGNLLLADGSPAPNGTMLYQQPNYAAVAEKLQQSKTIDVIGPNGLPTKMGWNPQTMMYDIPQGVSSSGAYGHEMAQAGAVTRGGQSLIADINANKEQLGTLLAWVKKHGLNTPIADPKLAKLQSELSTFAALQPAMHGFRSRSAQEAFENIIGGIQKNPEATIASIQGILDTASAINPNLGASAGGGAGIGVGAEGDQRGGKRKRNPSPPVDPNDPAGILK